MRTLFKGGTVITGRGPKRADVLIEGEKVKQVGRLILTPADRTVDVEGCLLFPGFIDAHTHFDLDVCNTTTADDFTTGSRAALKGGTTTVIDFACPNKGESLQYGLDLWHKKADGRTFCDYGFHMTIDDWTESIRAELPEMFRQGVSSFKMYMTYPAMMVGDRDMYWALKELRHLGGICGVHCENAGVIDGMIAEKKAAGLLGPSSHPESRPPYLEAEAVGRLLRIAQAADCPVVIVHLTNEEALKEVEHARRRGQKVYVETCPQYLLLDESVYYNPDYSQAARFVCAPPIREKSNQEVLWRGLRRGEIQTISTDHCSFTLAQKDAGREDFTKIPGGLPGVETRGELIYSYGVAAKKITLAQMLKAWVVVWVGNFVGALFIVFLVYMAGIYKLNGEAVANSMVSVAAGKVTIDWVTIFFRGVLCNIFVCLAVWIGTAGKTVVDKVVGILLPIAAFVACGFEHCVANMYFLPMGAVMHACGYGAKVAGADALNAAGIAFNLSAATLGNIVGGAVLVALGYWFIYAKKSEA